jgi:O-antigen/teichoic acid export membrane protein
VLFPAFAISNAQDPSRTGLLLNRGVKYTFLAMFPLTLVIFCLAPDILRLWLGASFAEHGTSVLRWLAVGILVNSMTVIPFSLLQGVGRPDLTGKVLLMELAVYSGVAWMLINRMGIEGAAIAWVGRATVEAVIFFAYSYHFLPKNMLSPRLPGLAVMASMFSLFTSTLLPGSISKGVFLVIALLAFTSIGWYWLLMPEEKLYILRGRRTLPVADSAVAAL